MATQTHYEAFVQLGDSRQALTEVSIRITSAAASAWLTAATDVLRRAAGVGVWADTVLALTGMTMKSYGVRFLDIDDTFSFPAANDNVYAFDKLVAGYKAGLDRYTITIPGRDDAAYDVASDGITVDMTAPSAVADYITAAEAIQMAKNGTTPVDYEYFRVAR